ncbi:MAG TPA: hypothetical protein VEF89_10245, partial [Solirubrobacteraceae bacterium]|nr:hypothetical protein [Solirubrobacteraceae bacterium]
MGVPRCARALREREHRNAFASPVAKHLLPFFAYEDREQTRPRRLDAITGRLVTEFTVAKRAEREILHELPAVLAELEPDVLASPDVLARLDPT